MAQTHALASVATFLLVAAFAADHVDAEDEWPRWRGPTADGRWHVADRAPGWGESGPTNVWRQEIGPGYSGIAVSGGRVYTMDRPATPVDRERVVCLDATNGKPLWEHAYPAIYGDLDYGSGPRCTPTVHQGRVYTLGAVGQLLCLDAATGEPVWSVDLVGEQRAVIPTWGLAASIVPYRDLILVHGGLDAGCYAAFRAKTGELVWKCGKDPAGYGTPILIEHRGRDLLVGWTPEHIVGLAPATGELEWSIPYQVTYGVSIATPIFDSANGLVIVCGYWHGAKAIRLGDAPGEATLQWEENRFLRGLMSQPLQRDKHAYLLDKSHGLVCFELATGKKVWTDNNRLTPRGRNPQANLVWVGQTDQALALNSAGELVLLRLDPAGYHELARASIIGETWAHPAFANGCVFARDNQRLVCVRLLD